MSVGENLSFYKTWLFKGDLKSDVSKLWLIKYVINK